MKKESLFFWDVVSKMNWTANKDYNQLKKFLLDSYSKEECAELRKSLSEMHNNLYKILDKDDDNRKDTTGRGYGLGDDSFGDLINEIIGRGQAYYELVLSKPSIAYEMATKYDFKESFSYSFPHESDWEYLDVKSYLKTVQLELESLNSIRWTKYNSEIQKNVKRYKEQIELALSEKDFSIIVEDENRLKLLYDQIKKDSEESDLGYIFSAIKNYKTYIK